MYLPRSSPDTFRVLDDLRRIVRELRSSSSQAQASLGVSGAQLFVLRALADEAPLSMNELALRTRTHQSTVSVVVGRLVEHGLVRRVAAADDARRAELRLSPRGAALLRRAPPVAQERLLSGLERLTPARRRSLADSLAALVQAMGLSDEEPVMFLEPTTTRRRRVRA